MTVGVPGEAGAALERVLAARKRTPLRLLEELVGIESYATQAAGVAAVGRAVTGGRADLGVVIGVDHVVVADGRVLEEVEQRLHRRRRDVVRGEQLEPRRPRPTSPLMSWWMSPSGVRGSATACRGSCVSRSARRTESGKSPRTRMTTLRVH